MKKFSLFLSALIGTLSAACVADEEIISVKKQARQEVTGTYSHYDSQWREELIVGDVEYIIVTAKSKVTIKKIVVNRGNCIPHSVNQSLRMKYDADLPKSLEFGQAIELEVDCNPLEATIETDKSTIALSWDD